jgi:hypothetical protein
MGDTCGCQWLIRFREGKRERYISCGPDRAEALRMLALHRETPKRVSEVARAPGLTLPEQKGEAWVYFLTGAHLTKIGLTTDLDKRLAMLQAASPVALTLMLVLKGGRDLERALHFDAFRRHGEWFALPVGWENDAKLMEVEA